EREHSAELGTVAYNDLGDITTYTQMEPSGSPRSRHPKRARRTSDSRNTATSMTTSENSEVERPETTTRNSTTGTSSSMLEPWRAAPPPRRPRSGTDASTSSRA